MTFYSTKIAIQLVKESSIDFSVSETWMTLILLLYAVPANSRAFARDSAQDSKRVIKRPEKDSVIS